MRGGRLAEAPRHVLEQEIREEVPALAAPAVQAGWPPEIPVFARTVAIGVFVLLVHAAQRAGFEQVLAEHARVVVLENEEILVIAERRLVPQRGVSGAAPEHWMADVCAVLFAAHRKDRRHQAVDLRVQLWIRAAAGDRDRVRRVRELQVVRRMRAQRLAQGGDE